MVNTSGVPLPKRPINRFLAVLGVSLVLVAGVGLFTDRNWALVAVFLCVGAGLCIIAVLTDRMEGEQSITPQGVKVNIAAVRQAEVQLQAGHVIELDPGALRSE